MRSNLTPIRRTSRRFWPATTAVLLTTLIVVLTGPAASAHAAFVSADPAPSSTLTAAPATVTLTFNEDVSAELNTVAVTDAAGTAAGNGDPETHGATVTQHLGALRPGQYTVSYRILSEDGHPISGQYTFRYTPTTPSPTPTTGNPLAAPAGTVAPPTSATAAHAASASSGTSGWIVAAVAVGVVLAGTVALVVTRRRGGHQP